MSDQIEYKGMKVRFVEIDSELANEYLASSAGNRLESKTRIEHYKRMMEEGKWCPFSTIIVNESGRLRDGHHRLIAQSRSNTKNVFIEIQGFKEEWSQYIDVGRPRSAADFCKFTCELSDINDLSRCVSIARFIICVRRCLPINAISDYKEISDFIFDEQADLKKTVSIVRELKKCGFRINQGLSSAVYRIIKRDNINCGDFFEKLITGADLKIGNPILSFREYMNKSKANGPVKSVNDYSNLAKCWNAYIYGEDVRQFKVLTEKVCESTKLLKAKFA